MGSSLLILLVVLVIILLLCSKMKTNYIVTRGGGYELNPDIWGPSTWFYIHSICYAYPHNPTSQDKKQMKNTLYSLPYTLPCASCQDHYNKNIKNNPPDLTNKSTLFKWSVNIHNIVNKQLNKSFRDYKDILNAYDLSYK